MSESITTTTRRSQTFAEIVAPLERASRRRLGNPALEQCRRAFENFPDGVLEVARASLADAEQNPIGLFVYRIRHGWHELEPLEEGARAAQHIGDVERQAAQRRRSFSILIDRADGVARETFDNFQARERRAAQLERELGPESVTRS